MEQHIIFLILIAVSIIQFVVKASKKNAKQAAENKRKMTPPAAPPSQSQTPKYDPFEEFVKKMQEEIKPSVNDLETLETITEDGQIFSYENEITPLYENKYQPIVAAAVAEADENSLLEAQEDEKHGFDLQKAIVYNAILERRY